MFTIKLVVSYCTKYLLQLASRRARESKKTTVKVSCLEETELEDHSLKMIVPGFCRHRGTKNHTCLKRGFTRRNYSLHDNTNHPVVFLPLRKLQKKNPKKLKFFPIWNGWYRKSSCWASPYYVYHSYTQLLNFLASRDVNHSACLYTFTCTLVVMNNKMCRDRHLLAMKIIAVILKTCTC